MSKKHSDLSFIVNEGEQSLYERFRVLIRDTKLFDVLVGYFYSSGFNELYKSLEKTEKIRILVGIKTDKKIIEGAKLAEQGDFFSSDADPKNNVSHSQAKKYFSKEVIQEMDHSENTIEVEEGIRKFIEWLKSGKLEIRAYPNRNLHAKMYIMSFDKDDRDKGRVITGSSNFTKAGLLKNLEFNVELKNPYDYEFALKKFNELWEDSVRLEDTYLETIEKTWLNDNISPYKLYLKFLYEHFKEELNTSDQPSSSENIPKGFIKEWEYQKQAVQSAKRILEEHGGVFLSDVVGLGKTYMSAMLAKNLKGQSLVLAPPNLLKDSNRGSWRDIFSKLQIPTIYESRGSLHKVIERGTDRYENVFIDEAHYFRNEETDAYEKLAEICRGKKIILVTATPLNNRPSDILSQIKLFQLGRRSNIPNVPDLDQFFAQFKETSTDRKNKKENYAEYIRIVKQNTKEIREKVLKYLMVRRTRTEIEKYFAKDLKKEGVNFPEVKDPEPIYYQFNKKENEVFEKTAEFIGQKLKYARYIPLTYYKDQLEFDIQSQKNLKGFMRTLLIKRLESSFHAFQKSLGRFISSYEKFLETFQKGYVYISKDYSNKIYELLSEDNEEAIQKLIEEGEAKRYSAKDFNKNLEQDLKSDLEILQQIQSLWSKVDRDPKLVYFIEELSKKSVLSKSKKLIIFTESKETAEYLGEELNKKLNSKAMVFTGASGNRDEVIANFDPSFSDKKEDYRILVATDVLAEGVNLHHSNVIINYDLPWNPTRLMQRAGRINRVDTKFKEIHIFNCFPTEQYNDILKLEETAKAKISAFINLLGTDEKLLTQEEVPESHELFDRLKSKKIILGEEEEDESELEYLKIIKEIRDENPGLFNEIKKLPKKARTAKKHKSEKNQLLTYFKKGKLNKFCIVSQGQEKEQAEELDFMKAAKKLKSEKNTPKEIPPKDFFKLLEKNDKEFRQLISEEKQYSSKKGKTFRELVEKLRIIQKDPRQLTEEQETYFKKVISCLEDGRLPKRIAKKTNKAITEELTASAGQPNALKIIELLKENIRDKFLEKHFSETITHSDKPSEIILSEYLIKE